MHLFCGFEQWHHDNCTIPDHKMQCVTLKYAGRKHVGMKPKIQRSIPDFETLPEENCEYILDGLWEEFMDNLSKSYENIDEENYLFWWCRVAEQWLLRHYAYAAADESLLGEAKYMGRGLFRLERTQVNKTTKEVAQDGDSVDPRLTSELNSTVTG